MGKHIKLCCVVYIYLRSKYEEWLQGIYEFVHDNNNNSRLSNRNLFIQHHETVLKIYSLSRQYNFTDRLLRRFLLWKMDKLFNILCGFHRNRLWYRVFSTVVVLLGMLSSWKMGSNNRNYSQWWRCRLIDLLSSISCNNQS